jgi:hypothetical protein
VTGLSDPNDPVGTTTIASGTQVLLEDRFHEAATRGVQKAGLNFAELNHNNSLIGEPSLKM